MSDLVVNPEDRFSGVAAHLENKYLALLLTVEKIFSLKSYIVGKVCEAVLTSTHNVCFGSKIRKSGIPLQTPVLLYKSGV